jgi:hypothetical protein
MRIPTHRKPLLKDSHANLEFGSPFDASAIRHLLTAKKTLKPSWAGSENKRQKRMAELNTDLGQSYVYK